MSRLKEHSNLVIGLGIIVLLGFLGFSVTGVAQDGKPYKGPRYEGDPPEQALENLRSIEDGLHYVAEKTRPAVVTVFVEKEVTQQGFPFRFSPFGQPRQKRKVQGLGSGVIIRSNGYIVTNYHVVKDVDEVNVLLHSNEKVSAELVGTDPSTDLAVLKIDRTNLPELDFADSSKLRVGEWAIAVGSPFSLSNSVSYGHISALERSIQAMQYENFIQTDAPINRGNSGGPLVNIEAEIIGINTLIQSTSGGSQGIGFASASNLVKRTASDIIEYGEVKRAWLGVSIQELPSKALEEHYGYGRGALVADVKSNSPADTAGLKSGDLIIGIDDQKISGPAELQQAVIAHDPGQEVTLTVVRDQEEQEITVTLGERPTPEEVAQKQGPGPGGQGVLADLGMIVGNLSAEKARKLGLDVDHPLPIVQRVQPGSIAHRTGLRPDDLILAVNRQSLSSASELAKLLEKQRQAGADSVLMLIQREARRMYVSMPLPQAE